MVFFVLVFFFFFCSEVLVGARCPEALQLLFRARIQIFFRPVSSFSTLFCGWSVCRTYHPSLFGNIAPMSVACIPLMSLLSGLLLANVCHDPSHCCWLLSSLSTLCVCGWIYFSRGPSPWLPLTLPPMRTFPPLRCLWFVYLVAHSFAGLV